MPPVRVLSYNIRSLRDDPAAVARVVRAIKPDVACLQEAPRFWGWRAQRSRLAQACGMNVSAGRRACGLAVLAAPAVRRVTREFHLLTPAPGLHRRGLAITVLEFGPKPDAQRLIAAGTHLDLVEAPRRRHVGEIVDLLDRARRRHGAPVVLTGDINEEPGGPSWSLLAERFQDAFAVAPSGDELTFSARNPRRRIDGVFADPEIEVTGCGVPGDDVAPTADYVLATDHLPVMADLRLPGWRMSL